MPYRRLLITTLSLTLVLAASALAAGALAGKTYSGSAPSYGYSEQHFRMRLRTGGVITLKVSGNGKTVAVHFSSSKAILYCSSTETLHLQHAAPARISNGAFTARVEEGFHVVKHPAIIQVVTGRFSGHTVHGTIRTEAEPCGGTASFTATAH